MVTPLMSTCSNKLSYQPFSVIRVVEMVQNAMNNLRGQAKMAKVELKVFIKYQID